MPDDTLIRPQQLDLESVHSITERIEDEGLKDLLRCMAKVIHSQRRRIAKVEERLTLTEIAMKREYHATCGKIDEFTIRLDALEERSKSNRTATDELGHIVTDFITRTLDAVENGLRDVTPEKALEDWYRGRA